jgi:hypothetical protein
MKIYPRSITLAAIVIVFFNTQISDAQGTSAQSELQATIRVVPNGKSTPGFEVELSNTGERDLVLNLGLIMADGPHSYAIHLALRDGQNNLQILDLAGPSIINGRIDPFIVPLPKRARIILPINLGEYWVEKQHIFEIQLKPGQYFLSAEYRGEEVKLSGLDMQRISLMPNWFARVKSMETSFVVPGN